MIALGGGAVALGRDAASAARSARSPCCSRSTPTTPGSASARSDRPLAQDEQAFRALYERAAAALRGGRGRARARRRRRRARRRRRSTSSSARSSCSSELVPGDGPVELVADAHVAGHPRRRRAARARRPRHRARHEVPPGEAAKTLAVLERLWRALAARPRRHDRRARRRLHDRRRRASRRRRTCAASPWVAVPTTLVGQVDAAIGGKTAIDLPAARTSSAPSTGRRGS